MYPMFVKVVVAEGNSNFGCDDVWYQQLNAASDKVKSSPNDRWTLLEDYTDAVQQCLLEGSNFTLEIDTWNGLYVEIITEQQYREVIEANEKAAADRELVLKKQVEENVKAFQYRQQVIATGLSKLTDEEIKFLRLTHLKKN